MCQVGIFFRVCVVLGQAPLVKSVEITKSGGRLYLFECDGDVGTLLSSFARYMYSFTHVLFVLPA